MSELMKYLLIIWAVVTAGLAIAAIYGQTLFTHEDDQLFLDPAESHLEQEQAAVRAKVNHLRPVIAWLGATSGTLFVLIAALWVYQGWTR